MTKAEYLNKASTRLAAVYYDLKEAVMDLIECAWDEGRNSADAELIAGAVQEALSRAIVGGRKGYGEGQ